MKWEHSSQLGLKCFFIIISCCEPLPDLLQDQRFK